MSAIISSGATNNLGSEQKPLAAIQFENFELPASNQRILGPPHPPGTKTPLAFKPSLESTDITLDAAVTAVQGLQANGILTSQLALHGVLLFRGLPIHDAHDFSKFTHAFGYKPHEEIGVVIDRPLLAPNVVPANFAPKEVLMYNHNECTQVPHAPGYIMFYSHKAPEKGGESPISSTVELFHRAQQEIPEFIAEVGEKGILSKITYKFDQQFQGGATLRTAFGKLIEDGDDEPTRRAKIETQIKRYGRGKHTTWEWIEDGIILTHRLPTVRTQPGTGFPTLFTSLAAVLRSGMGKTQASQAWKKASAQFYGDGTPIPEKYLEALGRITDEIQVLHKWEQGDVLVYDNLIAQHGRHPWEGEQGDRVVLATMWDGEKVPGAYTEDDWAQIVQAFDDE